MIRSGSFRLVGVVAGVVWLWIASAARGDADPVKEPAGFHVVRATHYVIHTGIDDKPLVADLARRMDVMYDQYVKALSPFKPPADGPAFPVYLFNEHKHYLAFTDYHGTNTGGLFVGGPRSYLTSFLDDNGRDELRRTLQHEAFHQFAYFAISKQLPVWLNEGMAQLFEEGIWTGRDFLLGQVPPWRVRQLQVDVRGHKLIPFEKFFAVTPERWGKTLHDNANAGNTEYDEAWAIAYFLRHGPDPAYHGRLAKLLAKLHDDPDADPRATVEDCFGDTAALQKAFERWVPTLQPTPEATLLERLDVLGEFLPGVARDNRDALRTVSQFRNDVISYGYTLTQTRGAVHFETVRPAGVYFSDLAGRFYGPAQLYFEPDRGSPLPDLVCRPNGSFVLRTRFYKGPKGVEHESTITPVGR